MVIIGHLNENTGITHAHSVTWGHFAEMDTTTQDGALKIFIINKERHQVISDSSVSWLIDAGFVLIIWETSKQVQMVEKENVNDQCIKRATQSKRMQY